MCKKIRFSERTAGFQVPFPGVYDKNTHLEILCVCVHFAYDGIIVQEWSAMKYQAGGKEKNHLDFVIR